MLRDNAVHWEALVYLEMFIAGIAAGAYVTAAILELLGLGRSRIARAAHLLAFPLMAVAALLLTIDLSRPERFYHMLVMSRTFLPMFKWWSPISVGAWALLLFMGFTLVSFMDALVASRRLAIGGWRDGRTLHGSRLGLLWAIAGGGAAFFIGAYSGVLLNATNFPGWSDSPLIGALFLATAAATGIAALILIQAGGREVDRQELAGLERASTLVIIWQMILLGAFLVSLGGKAQIFLGGLYLATMLGAILLGGVLPLLLQWGSRAGRVSNMGLAPAFVLLGGFLLRYAIVMAPQQG